MKDNSDINIPLAVGLAVIMMAVLGGAAITFHLPYNTVWHGAPCFFWALGLGMATVIPFVLGVIGIEDRGFLYLGTLLISGAFVVYFGLAVAHVGTFLSNEMIFPLGLLVLMSFEFLMGIIANGGEI